MTTQAADLSPLRRLSSVSTTALLVAAALVCWILVVAQMQGMDAGPGTDLGGLGWYLGIWVTMMAAMMLPSVAPMALLFAHVSRERSRRKLPGAAPTPIFLAGYLAAWTTYGLAAYGVFRLVTWINPGFLAWDDAGPYVAGGAIAAAGLYELTPLKQICLKHCRGPLHFIFHGWRKGPLGAVRMGVEHGAYCVGCCWGLMVILFALGVMSLFWMAVIAAVIFAEKILPHGIRLSRVFAVAFVTFGIWVALAPASVPGLSDPGHGPGMTQMDTRMDGP
jgi:predicted metal-binding membrane protein